MMAANPLKPSSCHQSVFGVCVLSSRVDYQDSVLPGPNTVSLTLVDGGLRAAVEVPNPALKLRIQGRVTGIPYDTDGWVYFSYVRVQVTLECQQCKRRNYITTKNKVNDRERIELKKYCRWDRAHTLHKETR